MAINKSKCVSLMKTYLRSMGFELSIQASILSPSNNKGFACGYKGKFNVYADSGLCDRFC
jgi:hypothetical protein